MDKNKEIKPANLSNEQREALHRAYKDLEKKESFTVQEAANLLLRSPIAIRQAVRRGELRGTIVDHQVICISRDAILDFLRTRPSLK